MSTPNGQKAQLIVEELIEAYGIKVGLTLMYLYLPHFHILILKSKKATSLRASKKKIGSLDLTLMVHLLSPLLTASFPYRSDLLKVLFQSLWTAPIPQYFLSSNHRLSLSTCRRRSTVLSILDSVMSARAWNACNGFYSGTEQVPTPKAVSHPDAIKYLPADFPNRD
jgi:hypothetical protein